MSKRKKNQKLQPVSNVLETLFSRGQSGLSDQFRRWRVWHSWRELVGDNIASYSIPVGYLKGTLQVWVKTPSHLQELSFGTDVLKDKVNQFVGFPWVKKVRLTLDRKDVPKFEESDEGLREYLAKGSPSADEEHSPDQ